MRFLLPLLCIAAGFLDGVPRCAHNSGADVFVEPLLPAFGYACEVGANDGLLGSNTYGFEKNKGWKVLCVEPNPLLIEAGRSNRALWAAVACGSVKTQMEFVCVGGYPYSAASGFHVGEKHFPPDGNARKFSVPVERLDDLLAQYEFPRLDLLSIDTEGHEMEVLRGIDLKKWKPTFIIAEEVNPEPGEMDEYLQERGYIRVERKLFDNIYKPK